MSVVDSAIKFFSDRSYKISHKAAIIVVVLSGVFIIDNLFNFSFNYRTISRINEIERVSTLLKDKDLDSVSRQYVLNLQKDIVRKKSIPDYLSTLFRRRASSPNITMQIPQDNKSDSIPNRFLFLLSTIGLIIIFLVPTAIRQSFFDKQDSFLQRIGLFITIISFIAITSTGLIYLFSYIPKLSQNTWAWNYILNSSIQILLFAIMIIYSPKEDK